jgi:hypothetical protein
LFGGDRGLQLIEHEDPLEAGLEIGQAPDERRRRWAAAEGPSRQDRLRGVPHQPGAICVLDGLTRRSIPQYRCFWCLLDEMTKSTDTRFVIITTT